MTKLLTGKAAHKHMENFFPYDSSCMNIGGTTGQEINSGPTSRVRAAMKRKNKVRRKIATASKRRNRRG